MKERVLGKRYRLSLVLAGDVYARRLNRTYRKKGYIPNVLAFPIDPKNGEIVLDPSEARRACGKRGESFRFFAALLFVHALLHLKGYRHGSIMEKQERTLLSLFHIKNTFRPRRAN
ncbi:MAG: rRNA maturation RNase YbeY [Candidatus Lloydbacteria bacterium RIFCSPHIGHO2_02_FULL_54_17]|uniref:rRNA maturation RNase YbeY n=1 Tax=Candidatus Lloydbacteria bacterium RIFCSPHIGHO2_02_FULL_54_17 TaxID=1798664 RepID=A0A1G2DDA8_9BACT|nr:MAG: rRNA maturation RNase YbeY [Candidatus Lloydbacteria bacterium RIFCSPHIGHO2_01_FULL_54_11]OGZ11619.1 MAG: rRNA maturation RNase YbeY [Candidatus Lloydbacteria bacterium RIFCSPHIGHO2_02_FULL_54_17]OGZ13929.1 MAG: rRNA maturation RNase YbeY [Candidatus Lloydbacteria bacterium RIFCSPLOWO2_01_FULL_54_18]OGZ16985.1 MAG: rRNA maturation RNase YbeY [Candidatus Lloydbacteria bacterium RIFCSPLOWO2_02_FULL_54_12]